MDNTFTNSVASSSAPSIGANSVVTDANSALSGGSYLQTSASFNNESYPRLPASPMSFSSNISGSSVMDGSSIVQQGSHQDRIHKHGASTATSQPTLQEPGNMLRVQKKPRLNSRAEDGLPQQAIQQLLGTQDMLQMQGQINPQLRSLIQQQKFLQQQQQEQQQMLSSPPLSHQVHMQQQQQNQQQQQEQLRQQLQQQMMQGPHLRRPYDSSIYSRRLMQYMYHQRHRPFDNNILYWRKFVMEFFDPHAKKRWCFSLYNHVGSRTHAVFQRASMEAWHCDICGSTSGKGFEASFKLLPRLNKINFDSGLVDEFLFLDMPHESVLSSGTMLLEYEKASLEFVYEHFRVIVEGQLRIVFTPELKILSWDFCARHHEELLPWRLIAPQVNQLVQVAQKYQSSVMGSASAGVSPQDLQTHLNMFIMAGRQLARNLDLPSINDLGFSKRYVQCLQMSEVADSMKDLIDFSWDHGIGPIESLKRYPCRAATKLRTQEMQEAGQQVKFETAYQNSSTKITGMHSGLSNHASNIFNVTGIQGMSTIANGAIALDNYQSLLRQSSLSSTSNSLQPSTSTIAACQEASDPNYSSQWFGGPNQSQATVSFHGPASIQGLAPSVQWGPHQQPPLQGLNGIPAQQDMIRPPQVNQPLQQQHVFRQLLQEMMNGNRGMQQHSANTPTAEMDISGGGISSSRILPAWAQTGSVGNVSLGVKRGTPEEAFDGRSAHSGMLPARTTSGSVGKAGFENGDAKSNAIGMMSRSSSFKSICSNQNPTAGSSSRVKPEPVDGVINLPDPVQETSQELTDSGACNGGCNEMDSDRSA